MRKEIARIIDSIKEIIKDKNIYHNKLYDTFNIPAELTSLIEGQNLDFEVTGGNKNASTRLVINCGIFEKEGFHIEYEMSCIFSKVTRAYYVQFTYQLKNIDPDNFTGGCIENDYYEPLTISQKDIYDGVKAILKGLGLIEVNYSEVHKTIPLNYLLPGSYSNDPFELITVYGILFDDILA